MRASVSMKEACVERNDEIQEFFQQVRHVFVITSNEIVAAKISRDYKNHKSSKMIKKWKTIYAGSYWDKE